ncbi:MAG TPA: hypothetical protein VG964_02330 [Candidatus Saccharimonadales bacterium]|nr:hypothetical protein [Candidatus Saccharimonadales bacterium]
MSTQDPTFLLGLEKKEIYEEGVDRAQGNGMVVQLRKDADRWTLVFPRPVNQPSRFIDELAAVVYLHGVQGLGGQNGATEISFDTEDCSDGPLSSALSRSTSRSGSSCSSAPEPSGEAVCERSVLGRSVFTFINAY